MTQRNNINRRSFLGRALVGLGVLSSVPALLSQIPQTSCACGSSDILLGAGVKGLSIGYRVYVDDKGGIVTLRDPVYDRGPPLGIVTGPCTIKLSGFTPAASRNS